MSVFARAGVTEKTVGISKGTIEVMTANTAVGRSIFPAVAQPYWRRC